jgi:SNF2 family DNA or RNA helicase
VTDLASLPEVFEKLRKDIPAGYTLSERVLDPVVLLERAGGHIVARLAGTRMVKGARSVIAAPTNSHAWVVDETIIRPLPRDVSVLLEEALGGTDPSDVRFSEAIRLLRSPPESIGTVPGPTLLQSGRVAADTHTDELKIEGLHAVLFPYQARGVQWMWETIGQTGGIILADEMGLGKTIQIIALLMLDPPVKSSPALIVCPTSLIANWVREIDRFAPTLSVIVHRGSHRAGIFRDLQRASVVITTYDTMVNDISLFSSFEWSWLICDEAQAIKNPHSNRRKAVVTIPRRRAVPMTGTPVENTLLDLWSLADFAIPGLLGDHSTFVVEFPDTEDAAKALGLLTDPIILKRRVADVAGDLPERIDIDIPIELDEQLIEHYRYVRESTIAKYPVAGALVATLQLQLFCAHPWLRQDDPAFEIEDASLEHGSTFPLVTPKMDRTVQLLHEAFHNGRKVIVFALFNRVGDLIREAFKDFPAPYWGAINGSTPQERRQPIIDEFSEHAGPACLILNPKAAGAGLNITAATVVIHYTPVWNPAVEAQASARAHRRGQTEPVTVYRLFYIRTVEEVMIDRALWKSELANDAVPVSTRDASDLRRALQIMPEKS